VSAGLWTRTASDGEVGDTSEKVVHTEAEGHEVAVGDERRGARVGLHPVPDASHVVSSFVTDFHSTLSGTPGRARTDLPSERSRLYYICIPLIFRIEGSSSVTQVLFL